MLGQYPRHGHANRIDRKHVDFVLCEPTSMQPKLIIELDAAGMVLAVAQIYFKWDLEPCLCSMILRPKDKILRFVIDTI